MASVAIYTAENGKYEEKIKFRESVKWYSILSWNLFQLNELKIKCIIQIFV